MWRTYRWQLLSLTSIYKLEWILIIYKILFEKFHPHSIFCFGFLLGTKKLDGPFNDCIPLAARTAVNIAPHGIPMVWAGIQGANPENFKKLMS